MNGKSSTGVWRSEMEEEEKIMETFKCNLCHGEFPEEVEEMHTINDAYWHFCPQCHKRVEDAYEVLKVIEGS